MKKAAITFGIIILIILISGCSKRNVITGIYFPATMTATMVSVLPAAALTATVTKTSTAVPVFTATFVATPVHSATNTMTPVVTPSFTHTVTQTMTPSSTVTVTKTVTRTATSTPCVAGNVAYTKKTYEIMSVTNYSFTARSQAELDSLNLGITMDPVDFNAKMVVGYVYMRNNSCFTDSLLGIQTNCSKITVNVYERSACPAEYCAEGYVVLCTTAVINKSNLPVQFNFTHNTCP